MLDSTSSIALYSRPLEGKPSRSRIRQRAENESKRLGKHTGRTMPNFKLCNPTVTVQIRERAASDFKLNRNGEAFAFFSSAFPEQITDAVRKIVETRGVEPRKGFVADELSVELKKGVTVSIAARCGRGKGFAIVRQNGAIVAHGFSGTFEPGKWQGEIGQALEEIWHDEMHLLALAGCQRCKGYGTALDEGEWLPCECTERNQQTFAVVHGGNQSNVFFNDVAEELAA